MNSNEPQLTKPKSETSPAVAGASLKDAGWKRIRLLMCSLTLWVESLGRKVLEDDIITKMTGPEQTKLHIKSWRPNCNSQV